MILTYTRHKVKEYDTWKNAFDENAHMLKESGITDWDIVQIDGDPTDIAVIVRCEKDQWDAFLEADRLKHGKNRRRSAGKRRADRESGMVDGRGDVSDISADRSILPILQMLIT